MNISSTNKKILFIAGTHGDEPIGPALLKELSEQSDLTTCYESVIGNPRVLAQNKRFTEADLNRVASGEPNSPIYEVARAAELVKLFKKFEYIADFHETEANDRIVIIVPRLSRESLAFSLSLDVEDILIWPSSTPNTGPLVQYAPYGIEIECGTKSSFKDTLAKLEGIIVKFLKNGVSHIADNLSLPPTKMKQKKFYLVYDKIDPHEVEKINIQDFGEVNTGHERFIALLFGKHQGLLGYKMRALDRDKILDMPLLHKDFSHA